MCPLAVIAGRGRHIRKSRSAGPIREPERRIGGCAEANATWRSCRTSELAENTEPSLGECREPRVFECDAISKILFEMVNFSSHSEIERNHRLYPYKVYPYRKIYRNLVQVHVAQYDKLYSESKFSRKYIKTASFGTQLGPVIGGNLEIYVLFYRDRYQPLSTATVSIADTTSSIGQLVTEGRRFVLTSNRHNQIWICRFEKMKIPELTFHRYAKLSF